MSVVGNAVYTPAYGFSMRDAHRKPAQPVRPPAVCWHLAFRKDSHFNFESQWIDRIELLILEIFHEIEGNKPRSDPHDPARNERNPTFVSNLNGLDRFAERTQDGWSIEGLDLLRHSYDLANKSVSRKRAMLPEGSRYETAVIETIWEGYQTHLRFEVFEEYFTLTTTISLRRAERQDPTAILSRAHDHIIATLTENPPQDVLSATGGRNAILKSRVQDNVTTLYSRVWDLFAKAVLNPSFSERQSDKQPALDSQDLRELRGQRFAQEILADFRGLVLCLDPNHDWQVLRRCDSESARDASRTRESRLNIGAKCFDGANGARYAETLMPILLAGDRHQPRASFENAEYTFSTFDGGRCLYGSSFGPQPPGSSTPLQYLLVAAHDDHRQLGTTLNRLHLMGTLRLAALIDFEQIISRHATLSNLDTELGHVQATDNKAKLEIRLRAAIHEARGSLRELRTEFRKSDSLASFTGADRERYIAAFWQHEVVARELEIRRTVDQSGPKKFLEAVSRREPELREMMKDVQDLRILLREAIDPSNPNSSISPQDRLEYRKVISSCGVVNRCARLLIHGKDPEGYAKELLSQVRHSLANMDERIKFGIGYRAERSKYSQERFQSLADAMNIESVPGFQKYNVFVRQRLERSYSLIAAIESRFRFIQSHVARLEERYRSIESDNRNIEIKQLQFVGEIATICFLLPYYLSELLAGTMKHFGADPDGLYSLKLYSWIGCVVAYATYLWVRHVRKDSGFTLPRFSSFRRKVKGRMPPIDDASL
jgi:hypothetical protein